MVILHITNIGKNPFSGIFTVAPQHIISQEKNNDVALINLLNIPINSVKKQIDFTDDFCIDNIDKPFNHPDIVIFHGIYMPKYIKIANQLTKRNIPYVIIPHCSLTAEALNKKKIKKFLANKFVFRNFLNQASGIQYLSEREMKTSNFGKNQFVSTNGMDIHHFSTEKKFNTDKTNIVFIGRIDIYQKGIDLLLNAIAEIKNFLIEKSVRITFYGPYEPNAKEKIAFILNKYNISEIVRFKSGISGNKKAAVLQNTDIFIHTSRFEGMPMSILEALSYGIPVIVTPGTTLKKLVDKYDAGWSAAEDSHSISKCLKLAVNEKEKLNCKSLNAIRLIEENFLWEKVTSNALHNYLLIIKKERKCF